jgi:uncharacterized protein (DUF2062 family)
MEPIQDQLKQGTAPKPLALALSLGLWLALLPILGATTITCVLAAMALRLNQVLMQTVNYLAYPLQLLLILPFYAAGARVFGGPALSMDLGGLIDRARHAPLALIRELWWVGLRGVAVWALLGLVVVPLLWMLFYALLVRFARVRIQE